MTHGFSSTVPLLVLMSLVFTMSLIPDTERFTATSHDCNDEIEFPDTSMPAWGPHRLANDKYTRIRDALTSEDVHSPPDMPKALYGAHMYSRDEIRESVPQKYRGGPAVSDADSWTGGVSQADIDAYGPDKYLGNSSYHANQVFSSMLMDCDNLNSMPGGVGRSAGAMVCGMQAMALSATRGGVTQDAAVVKLRHDNVACKAQEIGPRQTLQSRFPYYWTCMKANNYKKA